jgi:hypothetical protein
MRYLNRVSGCASYFKKAKLSCVWWYVPEIPVTWETEAEDCSLRPAQAKLARPVSNPKCKQKSWECSSSGRAPGSLRGPGFNLCYHQKKRSFSSLILSLRALCSVSRCMYYTHRWYSLKSLGVGAVVLLLTPLSMGLVPLHKMKKP